MAIPLAVGCDEKLPAGPPRYETHGIVTYRGKPVEKAQVVFLAPKLRISRGSFTQKDGHFRVAATSGDGLPEGVYTVVVRPAPGGDEETVNTNRQDLPVKYRKQQTSDLTLTVGPGENNFDIELADED